MSHLALFNENQIKAGRRGKFRWIILSVGIVLFSIAFFRREIMVAFLSFTIGALGGFAIDYLGIKALKLWTYPRQEFLKKEYFMLIIPGWGVFGMMVNLPLSWIQASNEIALPMLTLSLFAFCELPNIKIGCWKYNAPIWLIALCWIPLVICYRFIFLLFI